MIAGYILNTELVLFILLDFKKFGRFTKEFLEFFESHIMEFYNHVLDECNLPNSYSVL